MSSRRGVLVAVERGIPARLHRIDFIFSHLSLHFWGVLILASFSSVMSSQPPPPPPPPLRRVPLQHPRSPLSRFPGRRACSSHRQLRDLGGVVTLSMVHSTGGGEGGHAYAYGTRRSVLLAVERGIPRPPSLDYEPKA
ncbi:hypothetical protein DFH08DRAFT_960444 [Mycena albidolilacea]|uniref:Uncharacterized protein n=1 Tax=Mycena albidolilacea TaxID=1033008 RepID=A0AAD7ES41_9AGAR|nr:hypothetical protein DFH08DRAFT_960444 [Mycena albidolilacea]